MIAYLFLQGHERLLLVTLNTGTGMSGSLLQTEEQYTLPWC
ncbi:hypothetical protein [Alteribacillus iranensis]|nr:hypothetical protein [Alteribacillus iranensis]